MLKIHSKTNTMPKNVGGLVLEIFLSKQNFSRWSTVTDDK